MAMTQFEREVLEELRAVGASLRSSAAKQGEQMGVLTTSFHTLVSETLTDLKLRAPTPSAEQEIGLHLWRLVTDLDEDQRQRIADVLTDEQLEGLRLVFLETGEWAEKTAKKDEP